MRNVQIFLFASLSAAVFVAPAPSNAQGPDHAFRDAGPDVQVAQRGGRQRGERKTEEPSEPPPAREPQRPTTLETVVVGAHGRVGVDVLDETTKCGISRGMRCDIQQAVGLGLFETGLEPRFPEGADCRGIDEGWAISYTNKRDRENYHGGIDMPAPFGTPMIAAAAGTVVAKSAEQRSYRGIEIILRHSPEDTGLPVWTYTQYAHFDEMPSLAVGDRVRMGQALGPTGNSGFQRGGKRARRPAIHFAVWFSRSPDWAMVRNVVVPVNGLWMDPVAFYRKAPHFDSAAMKALPGGEKEVPISVMFEDGTTSPAGTKLVWPYTCKKG